MVKMRFLQKLFIGGYSEIILHLLQTVFFEQMPSKRLNYSYEQASPTRGLEKIAFSGTAIQLALLGAAALLVVVAKALVLA